VELIVIGAGASGLLAAAICSSKGVKCQVIEHMPVCGKKILMTGNGKCNITNLDMSEDKYYCEDKTFIHETLGKVSPKDVIDLFEGFGMLTRQRDGYVYPNSEQAAAVNNLLLNRCNEYGVEFHCECEVEEIEKTDAGYMVHTNQGDFEAENIILATGGMSYKKTGSDGSGYRLAKELGHSVNACVPALTALICREKYFKDIAGVRIKGIARLYLDKDLIDEQQGEIQFTDYGLSGIPIFNMSRRVSYLLKKKKHPFVLVDMMPSMEKEELHSYIANIKEKYPKSKVTDSLSYIVNSKMAVLITKNAGVSYSSKMIDINNNQIDAIIDQIKEFRGDVANIKGFDYCQVTAGGVSVKEINPENFESKLCDGLYIAGEMIDVDGICGGYNLHFAFAGAMLAAWDIIKNQIR